jgi:hypothetical protein
VWIVFGAVAYRCFAEGAIALGIAAFLIVLAHAVGELAAFEIRDRRQAREAWEAQRRAGVHLVSYTPDRDRLWEEHQRRAS